MIELSGTNTQVNNNPKRKNPKKKKASHNASEAKKQGQPVTIKNQLTKPAVYIPLLFYFGLAGGSLHTFALLFLWFLVIESPFLRKALRESIILALMPGLRRGGLCGYFT